MEEIPGRLSQQQLWLVMERSCPKSFFTGNCLFTVKGRTQVNGVSDREGLTHTHTDMHLGENIHPHTYTYTCTRSPGKVHIASHTHTKAQMRALHTLARISADRNNTDTWWALRRCSVCIPLPLCTHPPHSHKAAIKTRKTKTHTHTQKKEAKRGQQAASILLPPASLPFHPSSVSLYQMFTFPLCEKRGMWTDRVRKERNLAEGKGAKAFKVCHRAVTKAS